MFAKSVFPSIEPAAVLRRTRAGQREAVYAGSLTNSTARRLLLVVNGFTPIGDLLQMDRELAEPVQLDGLLRAGLLEHVEP